jgi:transcriptional regulator GlxA family with amidase domain
MIAPVDQIDLLFVIAPHALLLDIAGPAEAFRLANWHREIRGLPHRFRLRFAGPAAAAPTSVGLALTGLEPLPTELNRPTWVVLAGRPSTHLGMITPEIVAITEWLRRQREEFRNGQVPHRLIAICSGTLLGARAGLLANRRCTTHHELLEVLRATAPAARVMDNRVFVVDGPIASSAGITAGIDLALHLIAEECGEALAAAVAEDMVVYFRRTPGDPEVSPFLVHRRHLHPAVHRVQDAILGKPAHDWDLASLASVGHTTERHLLRLFREQVGLSPLQYLRSIRLERARQALACGASVTRAAESAGFSSDQQLRRAWGRQWGGSPGEMVRRERWECPAGVEVARGPLSRATSKPPARAPAFRTSLRAGIPTARPRTTDHS